MYIGKRFFACACAYIYIRKVFLHTFCLFVQFAHETRCKIPLYAMYCKLYFTKYG